MDIRRFSLDLGALPCRVGCFNQLGLICNYLRSIKRRHCLTWQAVLEVSVFKPDMFMWEKSTGIEMILDLEMTNQRLKALDFPRISGPSGKVAQALPVIAGPFLPTEEDMFACLVPSAMIRDVARRLRPASPYCCLPTRLGVDLAIFDNKACMSELGPITSLSSPEECDKAFRSLVAAQPSIMEDMEAHVDASIALVSKREELVYVCTGVGRSARHRALEPLLDRLMGSSSKMCRGRGGCPPWREICAFADAWVGVCGGDWVDELCKGSSLCIYVRAWKRVGAAVSQRSGMDHVQLIG